MMWLAGVVAVALLVFFVLVVPMYSISGYLLRIAEALETQNYYEHRYHDESVEQAE